LKFIFLKCEEKYPIGEASIDGSTILKGILRKSNRKCGYDSFGSGKSTVALFDEDDSRFYDPVEREKLLD
jgi:hypothetical protein